MTAAPPLPKLGVAFVPTLAPERLRELAQEVEASGLDELWVWEDCFKQSGIASATAALAWTERLTVGIGLLPVPLRNVALTAMELATLERLFPGRLVAGVGHGVQEWMDQTGARGASPLTLLREYATALRGLLAGERLDVQGRYVRLRDVALDWPPVTPPPLMLGGSGPKSLALTVELGDGTLLANALTVGEIADVAAGLAATAAGANADAAGRRHPLVATQVAATGQDAGPRLQRELPRWGRAPAPGLGVAGDAAAFAACVRQHAAAGVTSLVFQPTEDEPDLREFVRFLGAEVKPLVTGG